MAPKRILSIDGGGVRGVVAIAFIEALEARLKTDFGAATTIRDYFDLIGGTSTGALLATGLALGKSPAQMLELYFELAPKIFRRQYRRIKFLSPLFRGDELERQIMAVTEGRTLDTPDLKPGGLAIVTKRADTGSVWLITNNPKSKYWDSGGEHQNHRFRLADVVGASAAAPMYFEPERIEMFEGGPVGLFVDGGVSPHNNPALALLQVATIPAYGYGWPTGADKLEITSIGTGTHRRRLSSDWLTRLAGGWAVANLEAMIADCDTQVITLMQALGRSETAWLINREIGDLSGVTIAPEPLFTFRRYNVRLETDWLAETLGLPLAEEILRQYRRLDNVDSMRALYDIARKAAALQLAAK